MVSGQCPLDSDDGNWITTFLMVRPCLSEKLKLKECIMCLPSAYMP